MMEIIVVAMNADENKMYLVLALISNTSIHAHKRLFNWLLRIISELIQLLFLRKRQSIPNHVYDYFVSFLVLS